METDILQSIGFKIPSTTLLDEAILVCKEEMRKTHLTAIVSKRKQLLKNVTKCCLSAVYSLSYLKLEVTVAA